MRRLSPITAWLRSLAIPCSLFIGFWTVIGLSFASQFYLSSALFGYHTGTWGQAISITLGDWYVWALLSLPINWLARRFPLHRRHWGQLLVIHTAASLLVCLAYVIIRAGVGQLQNPLLGMTTTFGGTVEKLLLKNTFLNLLIYWIIVCVSLAFDSSSFPLSEGASPSASRCPCDTPPPPASSLARIACACPNTPRPLTFAHPDQPQRRAPPSTMNLRTLIVDDEPPARDRLRSLLKDEPDLQIVGECADGREAVAAIVRDAPDLVFLDIQMPELDGFDVIQTLHTDGARIPEIVFVTAFSQHALRAFDVHALDYLLKPFDRERLQIAVRRARTRLEHARSGELSQKLTALLAEMRPEPKTADRLAVKSGTKVIFVKTADIDWIEAADNYVNLHLGHESHLMRETLSALETRLDPRQFIRISRSTVVNVERIKELQPMFHGDCAVILRNGTRLSLSRSHRDKLNHLLRP